MKKFLIILSVLLILLIFAAAGGLYGAYRVSHLDTNYPKLTLDGLEVGGLTKTETVDLLNASGWDARTATPLTVTTLAGQSFTVDPLRSGLVVPAEGVADWVFSYGREGNFFEDFFEYLKCRLRPTELVLPAQNADYEYLRSLIAQNGADVAATLGDTEYVPDYEGGKLVLKKGWGQLQLDEAGLLAAVVRAIQFGETNIAYTSLTAPLVCPDFDRIHTELLKEPRDAAFTDDGRFEVIDEVVGCEFDVDSARALWEAAPPAGEVDIPMAVTMPAVTGKSLRDSLYRDLLGACTTSYWNSSPNRISNVELASSKIDGTILYPGDVFSYNGVVGARTTEAGFLPAPAYVDGDVKDEIGGGACQVSSTLYAATLFAFLETVERTNHYFPVSYMQLGTDATVTIPDGGTIMDLKFRNSRHYPIKIVAYSEVDEENYIRELTFEIWGTLEENDYMPIEFDNSWGWSLTYDRVIEPADPNRHGYKIRLDHEKYYFADDIGEGSRTLTHRLVIEPDQFDEWGNPVVVLDEILNPELPNGGLAMDTYYDHH